MTMRVVGDLSATDLGSTLLAVTEKAKIGLVIGSLGDEQVGPIFLSDAAVELFGHPRETLMQHNLLEFVAEEERERAHALIESIVRGEADGPFFQSVIVQADGRRVPVDVTFVQVVHRGRVLTVNFLVDVSERKDLEAKVARTDRLAAIGTLAAGVAHEINNPLAAMTLELASLKKLIMEGALEPALREEALARLADVAAGTNRVATIVRDLRTLSRVEDAPPVPLDIWAVVAAAKRLATHALEGRAQLVIEPTPLPPVVAHAMRLEQVFVNLFVNAAQAFAGPAEANVIKVTGGVGDGAMFVEVSDNGPGMSADVKARVFDPFFTTKPSGVGTGLGLALSQATLVGLGGEITVESTPGEGAKFRLTLPVRGGGAQERRGLAPARPRILIVDDEPAIGRSLRALLEAENDVVAVTKGADALRRLLGHETFDAVICDLTLGDLSGVEIYERLAEARPGHERRIVFMTGGATTDEVEVFLTRVANPRLEKPFELKELEVALRAVLAT